MSGADELEMSAAVKLAARALLAKASEVHEKREVESKQDERTKSISLLIAAISNKFSKKNIAEGDLCCSCNDYI